MVYQLCVAFSCRFRGMVVSGGMVGALPCLLHSTLLFFFNALGIPLTPIEPSESCMSHDEFSSVLSARVTVRSRW
jgi:hypothetical protein